MVIEVSLVFQNTHTIGFLVLPGQYYDQETGLHYNFFRDYDPSTGRYITADPRGINQHVKLMLARFKHPKLFSNDGIGITLNTNLLPLELNPYAYVANNPLWWSDPTGEGAWLGPVIFTCLTMYCVIHTYNYCKVMYPVDGLYPFGGSPVRDRQRVACFEEQIKVCVTFGIYAIDPIGSAASTVGEEIGKKTCNECQE